MGTRKKITSRFEPLLASLLLVGAACTSGSEAGDGGATNLGSGGSAASSSSHGGMSAGGGTATSSSSNSGGNSVISSSTNPGGNSAISSSSNPGGSVSTGGTSSKGGTSATGGTGKAGSPGTGGDAAGGTRATTTTFTGGTAGKATGGTTAGGTSGAGGANSANDGGVANDGGGVNDGGAVQACASPLPPITDYTVLAGPFATTAENNTGPDGKSVIYRPKTLGENGFLHAPIVFGPGINMQASQLSGLLTSFASHGYVVVGTAVLDKPPNDPNNLATMRNTLNWIIQQNDKAGSAYQGKLATKCAISMGYSVGGTAAVELGGDAAIATTVSIHGHTASSAMHGPLLQTSGDKDTVGRPMQQKTFDSSKVQTFFGTVSGADHGYIQSANGGVERHAIIAWMRYWINGDTGAKKYFWGDTCICCASPWMDPKRKNWQ